MESFPKKRGRPRKIPDSPGASLGLELPEIPEAASLREYFGEVLQTGRTRANRYYAEQAREVVKGLAEDVRKMPDDPVRVATLRLGMDWILKRKTVLTELGRAMEEEPTEQNIRRFQDTVLRIAERYQKTTAKEACARIRRMRLGGAERKERVAALHHDLIVAINLHRKRFPESTWADVQRALERTSGAVGRKL